MIVFRLCCDEDHTFDAWFRDGAAYEVQSRKGQIECPECGSVAVKKALMTPNLSTTTSPQGPAKKKAGRAAQEKPLMGHGVADVVKLFSQIGSLRVHKDVDDKMAQEVSDQSPAQHRKALKALEKVVRANCVDVGENFPEEARKMFYGEASKKNIYGRASADEIIDLFQEGIDVMPLPSFPKEDA